VQIPHPPPGSRRQSTPRVRRRPSSRGRKCMAYRKTKSARTKSAKTKPRQGGDREATCVRDRIGKEKGTIEGQLCEEGMQIGKSCEEGGDYLLVPRNTTPTNYQQEIRRTSDGQNGGKGAQRNNSLWCSGIPHKNHPGIHFPREISRTQSGKKRGKWRTS